MCFLFTKLEGLAQSFANYLHLRAIFLDYISSFKLMEEMAYSVGTSTVPHIDS